MIVQLKMDLEVEGTYDLMRFYNELKYVAADNHIEILDNVNAPHYKQIRRENYDKRKSNDSLSNGENSS